MAGALDGMMRSVAKSLIGTFGTTATITTHTGGNYDPITDGTVPGSDVQVVVPCSPPEEYKNYVIDGTRIQTGDMKILIPALVYATSPVTAQTITIRGQIYKIISVIPVSSGNQEAVWEVQLRR